MTMPYRFPPHKSEVMPNGLKTIILPDRSQPVIEIALRFCKGSFSDEFGKEGTADILAALMCKGTAKTSVEEFSRIIESAGAGIDCTVKEEHITFHFRMLSRFVSQLAPLFKEMILSPLYCKKEFALIKKEGITGLKAEKASPSYLASIHFNAELFSSELPYGRNRSIESLSKVSLDSIKSYYTSYFKPGNAILVIAGDFAEAEGQHLAQSLFGEWSGNAISSPTKIELPSSSVHAIRVVDKPELTQTTLMIGFALPGELHDDRLNLSIANYILGGGNFSSRLMKKVRSDAGNTYGISSHIWSSMNIGSFLITTTTQNNTLEQVLKKIKESLSEFVENGITDEELNNARCYALGSMAFELEGIENVSEKLLWLRFTGRDESHVEKSHERLGAISVTTVNDAIRKHFKPSELIITAVGKSHEISPILATFGSLKKFHFRDRVK